MLKLFLYVALAATGAAMLYAGVAGGVRLAELAGVCLFAAGIAVPLHRRRIAGRS